MGTFRIEVEVGDPSGRRYERVEALVDIGATYMSLPRPLLETLGVVAHARESFVLAGGRHVEREIGRARVRPILSPAVWCRFQDCSCPSFEASQVAGCPV